MIVERITWKVNHIHHSEFIKLVKAAVEGLGKTPRICSYMFGPKDVVTSDLEFETMDDRQKYWADLDRNQADFVEWIKKYPDLAEIGMTAELLRVH